MSFAGHSASPFLEAHDAPADKGVSMGTSIFAIAFDGGVIMGADSRTTTGSMIANRVTDKLTPLADNIICCRSGSAADTQAIADYVTYFLALHRQEKGDMVSVKTAANVAQTICYENKDGLSAGLIIGGWDKEKGGSLYSISLGGMMVQQKFATGGSGSTYIYGYVDKYYREDFTRDEAITFVRDGLALAMARDGSSGGLIRMAILTEAGVERRTWRGDEIPRFYEG